MLTDKWELKGEAQIMSLQAKVPGLKILQQPEVEWSTLVKVSAYKLQIRREEGWGNLETIDFESH